jgi:hypothetical protein
MGENEPQDINTIDEDKEDEERGGENFIVGIS